MLTELTDDELVARCWEDGDLSFLMHRKQLELRTMFHEWRAIDQTSDREHVAGSYPRVFAAAGSKRVGKTSLIIWLASELAVAYPGCSIRVTSAFQKNVDEIVGSVSPQCFETAPDSCRPQYHGKRGPKPAGLYFPEFGPMQGARIALAGMDKNPDALRGQANDFDFISEAAFIDQLEYVLKNVLYHQYQGRPHARLMLESSAPKLLGTAWERTFLPDAKMRGAYWEATIEDNDRLSRAEKDEFIAAAGGRGHPDCEREYFNLIAGDPDALIVPEFDESVHVVGAGDYERPKHALAHVGADPGDTDPFGLVWLHFNWDRQCIVVERAWQKSNASTAEVVEVVQEGERALWSTSHRAAGERRPELSIIDAGAMNAAKVWNAPDEALTFWDEGTWELKPNPYSRVSDVDPRFVRDLNAQHGMNVRRADKGPGSKMADTEYLRFLFRARNPVKIIIIRNAHTELLIQELKTGVWDTDDNGHRKDWKRSKLLGHLDALAALKYVARDVQWNRNPHPPNVIDVRVPDKHIPQSVRDRARAQQHAAYGGRASRSFANRPIRSNFR